MSKITPDEYLSLRHQFEPEHIQLIIIAESPPTSGLYFYDSRGRVSEPLFAALMRQLRYSPETKEDGLREFQRRGWLLVDATYEPVNTRDSNRDKVIGDHYGCFVNDLKRLIADRFTPIILIKANVCRILGPKLEAEGFNVLNRGRIVYFPSTGRQREFEQQFAEILRSTAIASH
jgi:hypothetical protein